MLSAGICSILLPIETKGRDMPSTLKDVQTDIKAYKQIEDYEES